MSIQELLDLTIKNNASDLHLLPGNYPAIRIDGELRYLTSYNQLAAKDIEMMLMGILKPEQKELLINNKEIDFSFGFGGGAYGDLGRFRANIYYQRGLMSVAFRYLQPKIKTVEELHLPKICHAFAQLKQGFILVTGPSGHGKSTTISSMLNEINLETANHILTIEDPIEYVYPPGKSIISQREMDVDTHSWNMALRSALREDPDVVSVGEMRDPETIASALTIAETGHLVFSTLHTNSAAQTVDRIIDAFPASQQAQVRVQLAATLKGVVSERLIPMVNGGRIPAVEVLVGTSAVASTIREGKTHLIDSIIQTSQDAGMISLEHSLSQLVMSGAVSIETAKAYALRTEELMRLIE